ncbi:MAG: hypothetical protein ACRDK2_06850 [Solirubrobacteraceae bacterium]
MTDQMGPNEDELRAAYEAELSRITSGEMILQAAASLLNIGARRLGLTGSQDTNHPPERDLDQVRDAIDAVRGLLPVLERSAPAESRPLREALSQLQMAYAREAQSPAPEASDTQQGSPTAPAPQQSAPTHDDSSGDHNDGPGPAESSGRLWVPGR